jgi:ATP-dependent 26S proteasome regulatory subunit
VNWDGVGGLDGHVRALKEMVMLPLVYPELFERMATSAPRGVLFYGPPGTTVGQMISN